MALRRPVIPCLAAFVSGIFLVHILAQAETGVWIAVMAGLCVLGIVGLKFFDKALMLILSLSFLAGGVRQVLLEKEKTEARTVVKAFAGDRLYKVTGFVAQSPPVAMAREEVLLRGITIHRESEVIRLPGYARVFFDRDTKNPLVGQGVSFYTKIRAPEGLQNFCGLDMGKFSETRQIYAQLVPVRGSLRRVTVSGFRSELDEYRRKVFDSTQKIIRQTMPPHEASLMQAMLFNDVSMLNSKDAKVFRDSNTFHLFVVSGMHVVILAAFFHILFQCCRLKRRQAWIFTIIVLICYLGQIGFVTSAVRAVLMAAAATIGNFTRREIDPLSSLLAVCFIMIAWNPAVLFQVGFLLSALCVFAMVVFIPLLTAWVGGDESEKEPKKPSRGRRFLYWVRYQFVEPVYAILAITCVLLPVQVFLFYKFNLLSILANLLQAFIAGILLAGGVLTLAAGYIHSETAALIGAATTFLMQCIYQISRVVAEQDWAVIRFAAFPLELLLVIYVILFSGYYMRFRSTPEFLRKSRTRFAIHYGCVVGLLWGSGIPKNFAPDTMEIYCFDVGQGDSTFIKFPGGKTMLIDGGRDFPDMGKRVVIPQLLALGVKRLDWVVATHYDSDHIGGLPVVLEEFSVGELWVPQGSEMKDGLAKELELTARMRGVPVKPVDASVKAELKDLKIRILNPTGTSTGKEGDNDQSIVVDIRYKNFSALLTGDVGTTIEDAWVDAGLLEKRTFLKLGHHGSRFSSGEKLINTLMPDIALASCGANNNFGHPHPTVLERVTKTGTKVYRTDLNGAVKIVTDGVRCNVTAVTD